MNACMHARHLRPLLSSVLRNSLAHPTSSGAAVLLLLYAHPAYNSSWLRANKKGGTGSLKKIRKMKLFRGHPVPGPRRAGNLSRKPRLSSHLVPARAVARACRS